MKNYSVIRICLMLGLFVLAGCSEVNYCVQCVAGHLQVMSRTRPIDEVLRDPAILEDKRKKLTKVLQIRSFAVSELGLPDNDSYRLYADIERPYVVWNVVATPEFSLVPRQWCYPVVGCVSYRGYYDSDDAKRAAEELASQGHDVDLYGVKAYSTLRWFDDPVLNTFLDGDDNQLAGLIFHELAHQVVYVPDASSFNEAFAKTVEMEGVRRWLKAGAAEAEWQNYLNREARSAEFLGLLRSAGEELAALYGQTLSAEVKSREKRQILARLEADLRSKWPGSAAIDSWLVRGLNNARLASIATYHEQVPAFKALLKTKEDALPAFYAEVGRLAKLSATERSARLQEYAGLKVAVTGASGDLSAEQQDNF